MRNDLESGHTVIEALCALIILSMVLIPLYHAVDSYHSRVEVDSSQSIQQLDGIIRELESLSARVDISGITIKNMETVHIETHTLEKCQFKGITAPVFVFKVPQKWEAQ